MAIEALVRGKIIKTLFYFPLLISFVALGNLSQTSGPQFLKFLINSRSLKIEFCL